MQDPPAYGVGAGYVHDREITCAVCTIPGTAKSTFVQWGRRACTSGTTVYNGWMGSGHYSHEGSGYDYLCMTGTPEYSYGITDGDNVSERS